MPAKKDNKTLAIGAGAAALLAYFMWPRDTKASDSTVVDPGLPSGPNGSCPENTLPKDGMCYGEDPKQKGTTKKKKETKKYNDLDPSDLVILDDCQKYVFGDETGEAWLNSVIPTADLYVQANYTNSFDIALHMLKSYKWTSCFEELYTLKELEGDLVQFYAQFVDFRLSYPEMYILLMILRNKIDEEYFDGESSIHVSDDCAVVEIGNNWWTSVGYPMTAGIIDLELASLGSTSEVGEKTYPDNSPNARRVTALDNIMKTLYIMNIPICLDFADKSLAIDQNQNFFQIIYIGLIDDFDNKMK